MKARIEKVENGIDVLFELDLNDDADIIAWLDKQEDPEEALRKAFLEEDVDYHATKVALVKGFDLADIFKAVIRAAMAKNDRAQ